MRGTLVVLLMVLSVLAGSIVGMGLAFRMYPAVPPPSAEDTCCAALLLCQSSQRQEQLRLQQHVREAQADFRRCLASHDAPTAAAIRRRQEPIVSGAAAARRAAILPRLPQGALVPRPDDLIDIVIPWMNSSDLAWQFAANAALFVHSSSKDTEPASETLLYLVRSIVKYGQGLGIGTIHLLVSVQQKPEWLRTRAPFALPEIRVVGDAELGLSASVFSRADLMKRVPLLLGSLRENFILWPAHVVLGAPCQRAEFWRDVGAWGPRIFVRNGVQSVRSRDDRLLDAALAEPAPSRAQIVDAPLAMSRSLMNLLQESVANWSDLHHVYAHWVIGHSLAGTVGPPDDYFDLALSAASGASEIASQVLSKMHRHTLVALHSGGGGTSLPAISAMMEQRWPFVTLYEKEPTTLADTAGEL